MPEMNGPTRCKSARFPCSQAILMTAHGRKSWRSVPEKWGGQLRTKGTREDLETVEAVIDAAHGKRDQSRLMNTDTDRVAVCSENDLPDPPLIGY